MDEQALNLEQGDKNVRRKKTVDAIMESVICEYEEGAKKANSYTDVEALTLEEDADKSNNNNNIDAVSTEDTKKASYENIEALQTEDDLKYSISENMAPVQTEQEIEYTSSEFDICNPKFPRQDVFFP